MSDTSSHIEALRREARDAYRNASIIAAVSDPEILEALDAGHTVELKLDRSGDLECVRVEIRESVPA